MLHQSTIALRLATPNLFDCLSRVLPCLSAEPGSVRRPFVASDPCDHRRPTQSIQAPVLPHPRQRLFCFTASTLIVFWTLQHLGSHLALP